MSRRVDVLGLRGMTSTEMEYLIIIGKGCQILGFDHK